MKQLKTMLDKANAAGRILYADPIRVEVETPQGLTPDEKDQWARVHGRTAVLELSPVAFPGLVVHFDTTWHPDNASKEIRDQFVTDMMKIYSDFWPESEIKAWWKR